MLVTLALKTTFREADDLHSVLTCISVLKREGKH